MQINNNIAYVACPNFRCKGHGEYNLMCPEAACAREVCVVQLKNELKVEINNNNNNKDMESIIDSIKAHFQG